MSNSVETHVTSSKSQELQYEEKLEYKNVQLQTTTKNIEINNEHLTGTNENIGKEMRVSEETVKKQQMQSNYDVLMGEENGLQVQKSVFVDRKDGDNVVILPSKNCVMESNSSVAVERSSEKGN